MAGVVAALVALPGILAAVPASTPDVSVAELVRRARGSQDVAYQGYAESSGRLPLPDAGPLDEVADLLGDRSRLRAWWVSPVRHRVDVLTPIGERDTYVEPGRRVRWDSFERKVRIVRGVSPSVRVPQPGDMLPAALGRRLLSGAGPKEVRLAGTERVAGHEAVTLAVTPRDRRTLVERIEVAVEPRTGLPLRVEVTARGRSRPDVVSEFLDLRLARPAEARLRFRPPSDAATELVESLDARELAGEVPFVLPDTVAGLRRRAEVGGGAGSYGTGYAILAVVPIPPHVVHRLEHRLQNPRAVPVEIEGGGSGILLQSSLLTTLTLRAGDRAYLLVGSVTRAVVEGAARQLVAEPPEWDYQ